MIHNFKFTHTIGDVNLTVIGSYWSERNQPPADVELYDVLHGEESIIELMSLHFVGRIEELCHDAAFEDWQNCQADFFENLREAA